MYGVIAAGEVLKLLIESNRISPEEVLVCQQRIDNLDADNSHTEFDVETILLAVFNDLNHPAYQFVVNWDHTHLRHFAHAIIRS